MAGRDRDRLVGRPVPVIETRETESNIIIDMVLLISFPPPVYIILLVCLYWHKQGWAGLAGSRQVESE